MLELLESGNPSVNLDSFKKDAMLSECVTHLKMLKLGEKKNPVNVLFVSVSRNCYRVSRDICEMK